MRNQKDFFETTGLINYDYSGQHLADVGGKAQVFVNCDFSYTHLERTYFHQAEFKNCKFIGSIISSCNFRSAKFSNCSFEYCILNNTIIDEVQIASNFPQAPIQKRDLIRSLRINALSVGNYEAQNFLLSAEMKANAMHHKAIFFRLDDYYKDEKRFPQHVRIKSLLKFFSLRLEDFIWGYGISPIRLFIALSLITAVLGITLAFSNGFQDFLIFQNYQSIPNCITEVFSGLLDLSLVEPARVSAHKAIFACVVAARTIALGLFVSVLYRRYAR